MLNYYAGAEIFTFVIVLLSFHTASTRSGHRHSGREERRINGAVTTENNSDYQMSRPLIIRISRVSQAAIRQDQ